jgi:hypothetical protein
LAGILIGVYTYLAASHERLPIPGRKYDHSAKYSLIFVEPEIRFEIYPSPTQTGVRVGIKLGNSSSEPIQFYVEQLDVTFNGVAAPNFARSAVRRIRIMPNQNRAFRAATIPSIPLDNGVGGLVAYSILYGPLNDTPIYRRTHKFAVEVTGAIKITHQSLRAGVAGGNDWTDIEPETDFDMPAGYRYPAPALGGGVR